jgi:hypothetical protein
LVAVLTGFDQQDSCRIFPNPHGLTPRLMPKKKGF